MEQAGALLTKAWEYFGKGGVLAWPLLAFSIVALAVFLERWWTYHKALQDDEWFSTLLDRLSGADFKGAFDFIKGESHPFARVFLPVLEKIQTSGVPSRNTMEKLLTHYGQQEMRHLERHLPVLSTIGNVAPLLGLTGTVLGMVKAFMKIETLQGKVDASVLAGGIWEALLTTLFGLAVAIPTVIAHNWLSARAATIAGLIQDRAVSFVEAAEEAGKTPAQAESEDPDTVPGRNLSAGRIKS